jgi:hypothetical protein
VYRHGPDLGYFRIDIDNDHVFTSGIDRIFQLGTVEDKPFVRPCQNGVNAVLGTTRDPDMWLPTHNNFYWDTEDFIHIRRFRVSDAGTTGYPLYIDNKMTSVIDSTFYHDANGTGMWEVDEDATWDFGDVEGKPMLGYFGRRTPGGQLAEDIAFYKDGVWKVDLDGNRRWSPEDAGGGDVEWHFGLADTLPVVGNFWGDDESEIGYFLDGVWFVDRDMDHVEGVNDVIWVFGGPLDEPVVANKGWYEHCL